MINFKFCNPTKIYFGKGEVRNLGGELKSRSKKTLILTGRGSIKKTGIFDEVMRQVKASGVDYVELEGIQPNPRVKSVYKGIEICRNESVDFILAVGGGSVIDAAKAIAAGVKYKGDVWDFFVTEATPESALPIGSVLTLSATGTEMNPNTVITKEEGERKLAISSPVLYPVFSILDPCYTFSVNKYHTAAGVADIMAHVYESYLSPLEDTFIQNRLAEALLKVCVKQGPVAVDEPDNYQARADIMWASTLALNGFIGSGIATDFCCHMIEHEISAVSDISHGAGLAIILPNFMKAVKKKYGIKKFVEYGKNVWDISTGSDEDIAEASIEKTRKFFNSIGLPESLKAAEIKADKIDRIAEDAFKVRPILDAYEQLAVEDIREILKMSL